MNNNDKTVLALGVFDGVHAGHQKLIKAAKNMASEKGAVCLVYTYMNHPATLLNNDVQMLTTPRKRKKLLMLAGADDVIMTEFTQDTLNTSPEDFLISLKEKFNLCGIVAGFNYSYGKGASGTTEQLIRFCDENGISARIVEPIEVNGQIVSSTKIRSFIKSGEFEKSEECLLRPYAVEGKFSADDRKFRINSGCVLPENGLYSGYFTDSDGSEHVGLLRFQDTDCIENTVMDQHVFHKDENIEFCFRTRIEQSVFAEYEKDCECTKGR